MNKQRLFNLAIVAAFFMTACSEELSNPEQTDNNTGNTNDKVAVSIKLTDAPGDYDEVNIYLHQIQVQTLDSTDSTWVNLTTRSGYYDLLTLQNGLDTTIVSDSLSKGLKITGIRMLLLDSNYVVVDDTMKYPLFVPSGVQSGFKLVFKETLIADSLNLTLDFDADASIIKKGNGEYQLKPVLKIK